MGNSNNHFVVNKQEVIEMIRHEIEFISNETFFYHNPDFTKVIYVSSAYEKILCGSKEYLYEHPFSFLDYILDEDKEVVMQAHYTYLENQNFDLFFRVKDKEGIKRYVHAITHPVLENGKLVGHLTRARDVTKEKNTS